MLDGVVVYSFAGGRVSRRPHLVAVSICCLTHSLRVRVRVRVRVRARVRVRFRVGVRAGVEPKKAPPGGGASTIRFVSGFRSRVDSEA